MADDILKERMLGNLKKSIVEKWGCDDNGQEVLQKMYLQDPNGCINEEYLGDDVLVDIQNKFYYFLGAIRDEFEEFIEIYIIPSYEDSTTSLMIFKDRVLYKDHSKAWNFWFESEEELIEEMYSIYKGLKKTWDLLHAERS